MLNSVKDVAKFIGRDVRTLIKMCEKLNIVVVEYGGKSISNVQLDILLKKLGYNGVEDYNGRE